MDFKTTKNKIQKILENIKRLNWSTEDFKNITKDVPEKKRNLISKKTKVLFDSGWVIATVLNENLQYNQDELSVYNVHYSREAEIDLPSRYLPYVDTAIIFKTQAPVEDDEEPVAIPNTTLIPYDNSVAQTIIENVELKADGQKIYIGPLKTIGTNIPTGYVSTTDGTVLEDNTKLVLNGAINWTSLGEPVSSSGEVDCLFLQDVVPTILGTWTIYESNHSGLLYPDIASNDSVISEVTLDDITFVGIKTVYTEQLIGGGPSTEIIAVVTPFSGTISYDGLYISRIGINGSIEPGDPANGIDTSQLTSLFLSEYSKLFWTDDTRWKVGFYENSDDEFGFDYYRPINFPRDEGAYTAPSQITYNKIPAIGERDVSITKLAVSNKSIIKVTDPETANPTYLFKEDGNGILQAPATEQLDTTDKSKYIDVYNYNVGDEDYDVVENHTEIEYPYYGILRDICFYKYLIMAKPELNSYENRPTKK